jgi:5-methylcytosine-specific restriction endonuclease McrA
MNHDGGQVCLCTKNHQPTPLELNAHHIWPKEYGGPSVAANLVWLCPTAHVNVHELLRYMVKVKRPLTWPETTALYDRPVSLYAWRIACEGYRRLTAQALVLS